MGLTVPTGAKQILASRMLGKRPADLVLISTIGQLDFVNPIIQVDSSTEYDWSWIIGLPCCFIGLVDTNLLVNIENAAKSLKTRLPDKWLIWDTKLEMGMNAWYLPIFETIHLPRKEWSWEFSFMDWSDYQNEQFKVIK